MTDQKIIDLERLISLVGQHKRRGKKIVLCHGVFDLLHIGHIKHFNEAKNLGDILIVTVTPDKYVNKGPNRPIFPLAARMESISALKDVDYVAPNISENALRPIKTLKPDIYWREKIIKTKAISWFKNVIKKKGKENKIFDTIESEIEIIKK